MPEEQTERFDELVIQLSQTQSGPEMTADMLQNSEAENIERNHVITATSMGLTSFSLFDMAALSINQYTILQHQGRIPGDFMPERYFWFFKQELKKGKQVASKSKANAVAKAISQIGQRIIH